MSCFDSLCTKFTNDFDGFIVSDVGLLIGVCVVAGVEHGEVDGAALLRVHPLVGGRHRGRRGVLQRLPAGPGGQAATVLAVDEPVLNLMNIIEMADLNTCTG